MGRPDIKVKLPKPSKIMKTSPGHIQKSSTPKLAKKGSGSVNCKFSPISFNSTHDPRHIPTILGVPGNEENLPNEPVSMEVERTKKQKGKSDSICKTCKNKFVSRKTLKQHEKIHLGIKNHHCLYCRYAAIQKSSLENHIRFHHTHDRPYKCDMKNCGYSSVRSGNLKRHQLTHRKDDESLQKFNCSFPNCTYKSTNKYNVTFHHKAVHLNIRNFICPFLPCEYAAKWRSHLNRHIKTMHKIEQRESPQ